LSVGFQVLSGTEPEKQVLVDRLVRLQRENARKAEKLDFLEEHSQQLLAELQKKTRIIQNYVMKVPTGALASDTMEHNKVTFILRENFQFPSLPKKLTLHQRD